MAKDDDFGAALLFGIGPYAAFDKLDILRFFHGGSAAIQNGVLNFMTSVLNGDTSKASTKILVSQTWIDGNDVGEAAHGHAVLIRQLFAIQFLGGGALAKGFKAKDPQVIGAQRADELRDVAIQPVDCRRDEDHGGDADGDSQHGQA